MALPWGPQGPYRGGPRGGAPAGSGSWLRLPLRLAGLGWLALAGLLLRISAGFGLILRLALAWFRLDLASGFHLLGFGLDLA